MALDMQDAEDRYKLEPVDALTPEKVLAARWAMALLGEAMNRLRQQYAIGQHLTATRGMAACRGGTLLQARGVLGSFP